MPRRGGGGDPVAIIARWLGKHLSACVRVQSAQDGDVITTKNDYELVSRLAVELVRHGGRTISPLAQLAKVQLKNL